MCCGSRMLFSLTEFRTLKKMFILCKFFFSLSAPLPPFFLEAANSCGQVPGYLQIYYVDKFAHLQLLIFCLLIPPPKYLVTGVCYTTPRYSLKFQTGSWRVIEVIYAPSFTHCYYCSLIQSCRTPWVLCFLLIG